MKKYPKSIKLHNLPKLRAFRRELRNQLTPAEAKLWDYLKDKQLGGRKFRRQHSVGPFVLDFYCPQEHLAVELDGQVHLTISAQEYDRGRDVFMSHFGIIVLRFENRLVFDCPDQVMNQIKKHFGWRASNHPGLTATPPLKGGEL